VTESTIQVPEARAPWRRPAYWWPLVKGSLTYVPGLYRLKRKGTGGTDSARYCYSVWLRHLVKAAEAGLPTDFETVAELGPGDSLGTGLAALLSGARRLYALDAIAYGDLSRNLVVFDELVELFRRRAPVPGDDEFPEVRPLLRSYEFPNGILHPMRLREALRDSRVAAIRSALAPPAGGGRTPAASDSIVIQYCAPWFNTSLFHPGSVDLIFSQAVLEHVDDVGLACEAQSRWLRPGGTVSHTIDYRSHGITPEWNGHWAYSERAWKLAKGRRPFLLNRMTHSQQRSQLEKSGFAVVSEERTSRSDGLPKAFLNAAYLCLPSEDLTTSGGFLQATLIKAS
jgi:SAM-dependent methyltransferase